MNNNIRQRSEYLVIQKIVLELVNDKIDSHLESRKYSGIIEISPEEIHEQMQTMKISRTNLIKFFDAYWTDMILLVINDLMKKSFIRSISCNSQDEITIEFFVKGG